MIFASVLRSLLFLLEGYECSSTEEVPPSIRPAGANPPILPPYRVATSGWP